MKIFFVVATAALFLFGCKSETTPATATGDSSTLKFAYTIGHPPDNWTPGDINLVNTVLNSLKAYELGDIATCMKGFGDSVKISFDAFEGKFSNNGLKSIFIASRDSLASLKIKMDDWESVISKDKKTEFVSLWYKQIWTTNWAKPTPWK
jgi:hypothetical protein